jgi:hypothetical protein
MSARRIRRSLGATLGAAVAVLVAGALPAPAPASYDHGYARIDLVSDQPRHARLTDPHLVNPWGLALGPTSPLWVESGGLRQHGQPGCHRP